MSWPHDDDPRRCQGIARYSVQCKNRIKVGEVVCHLHVGQREWARKFAALSDPAIDEYVIRVGFVEGLNAGVSVTVGEPHDINVTLTEVEEQELRDWLDRVVLAHPEAF